MRLDSWMFIVHGENNMIHVTRLYAHLGFRNEQCWLAAGYFENFTPCLDETVTSLFLIDLFSLSAKFYVSMRGTSYFGNTILIWALQTISPSRDEDND